MKFVISDNFKCLLEEVKPHGHRSCFQLLDIIIGDGIEKERKHKEIRKDQYRFNDADFIKLRDSALFIFDEIIHFYPKKIDSILSDMEIRNLYGEIQDADLSEFTLEQLLSFLKASKNTRDIIEPHTEDVIKPIINNLLPSAEVVLSADPFITRNSMFNAKSISRESVLLMLAASGICFCLPSVFIKDSRDIEEFKEKYEPERLEYLQYLYQFLDEVILELNNSNPNFYDMADIAEKKFALGLKLKAQHINAIVKKESKIVSKKIHTRFIEEVPEITSNLSNIVMGKNPSSLFKNFFNVLLAGKKAKQETRKFMNDNIEAVYIYQIKKQFGS